MQIKYYFTIYGYYDEKGGKWHAYANIQTEYKRAKKGIKYFFTEEEATNAVLQYIAETYEVYDTYQVIKVGSYADEVSVEKVSTLKMKYA